mmetsp:Transcript_29063/g.48011  ORF Transcript_29063/g.48011 Transcript_29063/m.48011 type:complete len:539 (+) Transcript_29063:143-1759(+)|eukprot:CAMPEP_0119023396 /NCGR_PEP_ID=MMETSP1176-20130426/29886_1 /TAXON_ID=265551 /ORGANISM="Synedropsis recta cf, Strain CCMP1620" /LENGTH=538 /DNA_ID=CAMNT_0006978475 /DNA_START=137 /DNA_END=1753 /DNA_ORIENTATION=-
MRTCIHSLVLCILVHASFDHVRVDAQDCTPTPDLGELETWALDIRTAAAGLTAASSECPIATQRQRVLMIGIDGLRADAGAMLPLPNLRRLERIGAFSYWANVQTTASAVSGPGWASLLTGVEPAKHKVDGNGDLTDVMPAYPNFLKAVKDTFGKSVAASVNWSPLIDQIINHQDASTLDASYKGPTDDSVAAIVKGWIEAALHDLVFVAFDAVDHAGHSQGFDGYADPYARAVIATDALVGTLLDAVLARSGGEEWLILITTDHGGSGTSHGGADMYNRRVPLIVASNSPRVNIGRAAHDDPGSQMDILPTIMHFFGGPDAIPSGLDGQVFGFNDYTRTPPPICGADPSTCGCPQVQQSDYRGTIATTVSGKICQRWDAQSPHSHTLTPNGYPLSGLGENYCRNPDGEPSAWCYTTDANTRFELCLVPTCDSDTPPPPVVTANPTPSPPGCNSDPTCCGSGLVGQADYRGTIAVTASLKTCQNWNTQSPHSHSRTAETYPDSGLVENYCRNPDGEGKAWCYTTDENSRWETCNVPEC